MHGWLFQLPVLGHRISVPKRLHMDVPCHTHVRDLLRPHGLHLLLRPGDKKIFAHAGLSFALISTATLVIDYFLPEILLRVIFGRALV